MSIWPFFTRRPTQRLVILRAHKTASQSFRLAYQRAYRVNSTKGKNIGFRVKTEHTMTDRFLAPHMTFESWRALAPPDDWVIAVTMRDPVKRLRSAFRYFANKPPGHPTGVYELLAGMDYDAFLASTDPDVLGLKDNYLVRFVGGGAFQNGTEGRNKVILPEDVSIDQALEVALARYQSGSFLPLIVEQGAQSIAALNQKIGYEGLVQLPHINSAKSTQAPVTVPHAPTPAEAPWVEKDMALYDAISGQPAAA